MGKASKWFRALLGLKPPATSLPPSKPLKQPKRRWSFGKTHRDHSTAHHQSPGDSFSSEVEVDLNKNVIAVAAATAAVADAAVKTAQAAAAVVRLTSNSRSTASGRGIAGSFGIREELAAVKIQSNFRAYLARRALRALKGLVKLQALVRGHIVRKQTADMLRRMQALLRAQTRARSMRSESSSKSSSHFQSHYHGPATPEKFEHPIHAKSTKNFTIKRNGSKSYGRIDDEKILGIDSGKSVTQKRKILFHHAFTTDQNSQSLTTSKDSTIHQTIHSQSSYEVQSYFSPNDDEATSLCTMENSPIFYSASSRAGTSICGDRPSYMALTESSIAKVRSFSAPRQRPRQLDRSNTGKINSNAYGFFDSRSSGQKTYTGSSRLDRSGIPASGGGGGDVAEISMMYLNRY